jgi:RES domain-containing protein
MRTHGVASTQTLAARLLAARFSAVLVPSFAPGATSAGRNLVVLHWNLDPDATLKVIDDEGNRHAATP